MAGGEDRVWIGVACVAPLPGSDQERSGLKGGYGFVACRARSLDEGVRALGAELAEGGSALVGFEWLHRLEDTDRELREDDRALIDRLALYPVQFRDFERFRKE
jgi:hypothetical protein